MERTDVGQHKEEKYFIYVMHNAVIRLDVMVCRVFAAILEYKYSQTLALALELFRQGLQ
jgi:hypothetical protein